MILKHYKDTGKDIYELEPKTMADVLYILLSSEKCKKHFTNIEKGSLLHDITSKMFGFNGIDEHSFNQYYYILELKMINELIAFQLKMQQKSNYDPKIS